MNKDKHVFSCSTFYECFFLLFSTDSSAVKYKRVQIFLKWVSRVSVHCKPLLKAVVSHRLIRPASQEDEFCRDGRSRKWARSFKSAVPLPPPSTASEQTCQSVYCDSANCRFSSDSDLSSDGSLISRLRCGCVLMDRVWSHTHTHTVVYLEIHCLFVFFFFWFFFSISKPEKQLSRYFHFVSSNEWWEIVQLSQKAFQGLDKDVNRVLSSCSPLTLFGSVAKEMPKFCLSLAVRWCLNCWYGWLMILYRFKIKVLLKVFLLLFNVCFTHRTVIHSSLFYWHAVLNFNNI